MFNLYVRTEDDAFGDSVRARDAEVARILRATAARVECGELVLGNSVTLFDSNGNDVGRAKLTEDDSL